MKSSVALAFRIVLTALLLCAGSDGIAQDPVLAHPDFFKVLLENDRVRVIDDLVPAGAKVAMHSHPEYVLEGIVVAKQSRL